MPANPYRRTFDLSSPDGVITKVLNRNLHSLSVEVEISHIPSYFLGFDIDITLVDFNLKSTFAQLGVDAFMKELSLDKPLSKALLLLELVAFTDVGSALLNEVDVGVYVGKLFAKDDRRRVRSADYITRNLGRSDHNHKPLLMLSERYKHEQIIEQPEKNRTIALIPLQPGFWTYDNAIKGFLSTIAKGLKDKKMSFRKFLFLHQIWHDGERVVPEGSMLLVRTTSMSLRTVFARVAHDELPKGVYHAKADVLESHMTTGDIFEFHTKGEKVDKPEIHAIPLEFYTLEPYREFVFFADREQLKDKLEKPETLFNVFDTAPKDKHAAVYIVKGSQIDALEKKDWLISDPPTDDPLIIPPTTPQEKLVFKDFLEGQALYPILDAMQDNSITSQGALFTNYFPAPQLKSMLLSDRVGRYLKEIYFLQPSQRFGDYFSAQDRSLLFDLAKENIDVFWVDKKYNLILKYTLRRGSDFGVFVPIDKASEFHKSTVFGVYGSKIDIHDYFNELYAVFQGLLQMKKEVNHFMLNSDTPIALSTGGGPGIMQMGNKVASECGVLSIGHAVNFKKLHEAQTLTEPMNNSIQGKMTYRIDNIITRQAEFNLDFPIFFMGGVGTDFEYALELLRVQVHAKRPTPILLFGPPEYWAGKITPVYKTNLQTGTIVGTEWTSNVMFVVQNASQALSVYYQYFTGTLKIGPDFPPAEEGFHVVT